MYLIISPIKIEKFFKYDYLNGGNLDFETYMQTSDGKEFFEITPLIIDPVKNKKELVHQIAMDITWLSLCYNCSLYIYVMTDNWYYKNLHLHRLRSRRNFGKCTQMQNLHHRDGYDLASPEVQAFRVSQDFTYYKGDMDVIRDEISKIILDKSFNLRENPIQCIRLTTKDGFRKF